MYKVSEEHEMLRELVKKFVRNELMPLEKNILDRFASGQPAALSDEENLQGLAAGGGINYGSGNFNLGFDYAYKYMGILGPTNFFSFSVNW